MKQSRISSSRSRWIGLSLKLAAIASVSAGLVLPGCKEEGPMEKAGKKIDNIGKPGPMEKAGQELDKAGDHMKKAAEKATDGK